MNNDNNFLTRSNYLVAFLAALIGLAAFKDELSAGRVGVFGNEFTWLSIAVPMSIAILVASYVGALSHFSSNITFTKIPLTKYLGIASTVIAILGLIYPIIWILVLGISWLVAQIDIDSSILSLISGATTIAAALAGAIAATITSIMFYNLKNEKELRRLILKLEEPKEHSRPITEYDFLQEYEKLVATASEYLRLRGFGVGSHNGLLKLARILQSKNIFDALDVDNAALINKDRNLYAHGQKSLKHKEIRNAIESIQKLQEKIEKAIIDWGQSSN
jgi:hypothetical protein